MLSVLFYCAPSSAQDYSWLSENCRIDSLSETSYAQGWLKWQRATQFRPKGVPLPTSLSGRHRYSQEQLKQLWEADPKSHVVDCSFQIPRRSCQGCRGRGTTTGFYVAYVPKALLESPEKVRSVLLLIPGGNGLRTRYFLTPIPNKTIFDKMSGGLETKKVVDEALTPEISPPIVVSLDAAGWMTVNGPTEYITHDVPQHIVETFLPGVPFEEIALGAEGISSGGRAIMEALRWKPNVFNSVGLTAMHCRNFGGIDPKKHLGPELAKHVWLGHLAKRARAGLLHIRFSVGNEDAQWGCNKEFHTLFVESQVLPSSQPQFGTCRKGRTPSPDVCDTAWDGFYLYDGIPHHYGIFLPSYRDQIRWHLQSLTKTIQAFEAGVSQ